MNRLKMNYPLVIEFNGIPGSGKSTISDALEEKLKKQGLTVVSYREHFKKYSHNRKYQLYCAVKHAPQVLRYYFLLRIYISKIKMDKMMYKYFIASVLDFGVKLEFLDKTTADVIILDQGIIQELLSIYHIKEIVTNNSIIKIFNYLSEVFKNLVLVNVEIPIEIACQRVNSRLNGKSRVDNITDFTQQIQIQQKEYNNLKTIREANQILKQIVIISESIDISVDKIINSLDMR